MKHLLIILALVSVCVGQKIDLATQVKGKLPPANLITGSVVGLKCTQISNDGMTFTTIDCGDATKIRGNAVLTGTPTASGQQYVWNSANSDFELQAKLTVDVRDPIPSYSAGAKCDNSTDDTAAIQGIFNYYGKGGPGAGRKVTVLFPAGMSCKQTNQLVFEGDNGIGIDLDGVVSTGGQDTRLAWFGPNFGTQLLLLSCDDCSVNNLTFLASPTGGGLAQNSLWWDATNTVTQVVYNDSSITRASNVVTSTTSAAHVITPGRIVKVAGVTDVSFNGTFRVLYSNDNTHVSWIQGGVDATSSGGTVTNYHSAITNHVRMHAVKVSNPQAVSSSISAISWSSPTLSITTSTPHFFSLSDTIIVRGVTDIAYNCAYTVTTIPTSTTATAVVLPGTGCAPTPASSSGGTVLSGSTGIRIGHRDASTPQVAAIQGDDLFMQGDQLGGSVTALQADVAGNVKNFGFNNIEMNGFRYGFTGFNSGSFNVAKYHASGMTPDATALLATIDFVDDGSAQTTIDGAETEATNSRFWVSTGYTGTLHIDGLSFQSSCPTDDLCIGWAGTLELSNSLLNNNRIAGSTPYLVCNANPVMSDNNNCSLDSHGNFYANTFTGGAATALRWIPVKDGSANTFKQAGGYYENKQTNFSSRGDQGSASNVAGTAPRGTLFQVQPAFNSTSNCSSSAAPAVCSSSVAGSVVIAAAATTVVVNTIAVSANSQIFVTFDESLGTKLGVTCNNAGASEAAQYFVSARTAGTSFTIKTSVAPTTNPACLSYVIMN